MDGWMDAEMLCSQGAVLTAHQAGSAQHHRSPLLRLHRNFSLVAEMSLPLSSSRGSSSLLRNCKVQSSKPCKVQMTEVFPRAEVKLI